MIVMMDPARSRKGVIAAIGTAVLMLAASGPGAQVQRDPDPATIEIYPSDANATCQEEFLARARSLRPGDTLVLHGGVYTQSCGRRISNLHGAPGRPIVIRAAEGQAPVLTRPPAPDHDYPHNNLEIQTSSYLTIRGLRFRGGSIGLRFRGPNRHITIEDNEISGTGNNAISLNDGDTDAFVIRGNHIHDTGLLALSAGTTEGEGIYVGCNNRSCIASNHLIERNYIHHLRGTSDGGNDGIEIKPGSHGITIRDNVIHDTTIGTRFPCIFVYGGGIGQNVVERNAVWNCGEGVQAISDVIVRNNVIANSDVGIAVAPHVQVPGMKNVAIVNNTLYGHDECVRARWANAQNMVLANNAIYCPGKTAVDGQGLSGPGKVVAANVIEGALVGVARDELQFRPGAKTPATFADAAALNFWPRPSSALIGTGLARLSPDRDFNDRPRQGPPDVGAYQTNGSRTNPGWTIGPGFKRQP